MLKSRTGQVQSKELGPAGTVWKIQTAFGTWLMACRSVLNLFSWFILQLGYAPIRHFISPWTWNVEDLEWFMQPPGSLLTLWPFLLWRIFLQRNMCKTLGTNGPTILPIFLFNHRGQELPKKSCPNLAGRGETRLSQGWTGAPWQYTSAIQFTLVDPQNIHTRIPLHDLHKPCWGYSSAWIPTGKRSVPPCTWGCLQRRTTTRTAAGAFFQDRWLVVLHLKVVILQPFLLTLWKHQAKDNGWSSPETIFSG